MRYPSFILFTPSLSSYRVFSSCSPLLYIALVVDTAALHLKALLLRLLRRRHTLVLSRPLPAAAAGGFADTLPLPPFYRPSTSSLHQNHRAG